MSRQTVEFSITAAERLNETLNAFLQIDREGALRRAEEIERSGHGGPLAGIPIAVADPIWQKQLTSMRGQLLFRLNTILGQPLVSALDFAIDPKLAKPRAEQTSQQEEPLDNEVPLELWSAANAIHDKELRKNFLRTALLALKRKK